MKKLYGVTTAMTTPFGSDGGVDLGAVAAQTEMLLEKGVHCLYPCGTTGEMTRMTVAERQAVTETVVRTAAGRAPVFIHCGAASQEDTEALLRHAEAAGADGAGVVTPWFLTANRREMEAYYAAAAACVSESFPLYLYNIPQCAANDLDAETAAALAERFPNIVGVKYSYADINRTMDYLRVRNWSFSVMHGCDRVFLAFLALGCDGTVSGVSGVFPEPFTAVYRAFQAGDWAGALAWQRRAARITDILRGGSNMSYFKEALKLRGLDAGHMRRPQLDLPAAEVAALKAQLEDFCQDAGVSLKL